MYDMKDTHTGIWIMYLRKSRQDDPNETVAEVLAKHEVQLQEYALRELGGRIAEENIYREVKSGESIDEREEIQKVLARIEDPRVKGVLVIEPQRLSRGDLEDCGRLINTLRFTHTQVCTPMMTYDLESKMERKFFQDELLRGRDYLEYTKEILLRGRIAAIKRGCFIGTVPPFGYNKIQIGKDHTLEPNEDAELVRTIFTWYVKDGLTPGAITRRLNDMLLPGPWGGEWNRDTIRNILRNPHYIGKVAFNQIKRTPLLENGEVIYKRLQQPKENVILAEGKHPAIVDKAVWEAAQVRFVRNVPLANNQILRNPLSGILTCANCGHTMAIHTYQHTESRFECRSHPRCYKSVKYSDLLNAIIYALEQSELPQLELKLQNGDGDAAKIQQRLLAKLEKQMEEYREQEDKQFELLETGTYSREVFERRNRVLREKMELCQKQINEARANLPKDVDYAERIATLQTAIDMLKDPDATPEVVNRILKSIINKIVYTGLKSQGTNRKGVKRDENSFSLEITLVL